jgi:hypothetical protein
LVQAGENTAKLATALLCYATCGELGRKLQTHNQSSSPPARADEVIE